MEPAKRIGDQFPDSRVFIVEDDPDSVESIRMYLKSAGIAYDVYQTGEAFLENLDPVQPGCVLIDYRLSGMNGLEIQDELIRNASVLPVIVISGFADVQVAVLAMRRGAITLLQKPFMAHELIQAVAEAFAVDLKNRDHLAKTSDAKTRLSTMTCDERLMIWSLLDGKSNRSLADQEGVSVRTTERRRHRIFDKAQVESVVDLAELVKLAGWERPRNQGPGRNGKDDSPDDPNQPKNGQ